MYIQGTYYETPEGCPPVCTAQWDAAAWARWEETQRKRQAVINEALKNCPPEPIQPLREGWYLIKPMGAASPLRCAVQVHPKEDFAYVLFDGERLITVHHEDMLFMQASYCGDLGEKKPKIY